KVKKYFASIPRQESPKPVDLTEPKKEAERRFQIDDKLARVARLDMAYRLPDGASPETRALSVGASILGGGESSRLYQKLVKEKELASSISCYASGRAGPSAFQIVAMVPPGKDPAEVEGLISEEIAKFLSEPVTDRELAKARTAIRRSMLFPRESVLSTAISLADNAALYNDPDRFNTEPEKRLAVTAEEIQAAAKKYLRNANRVVIVTEPAAPAARPPAAKPGN
ncbi:MAG: insulinase family protein, partial [Acidobacteriota bacterium]